MTHNKEYYCNLKTYRIVWPKFELGFELCDVQRMVYNEAIIAKQKIVEVGNDFMVIQVTEAVAEVMKKALDRYTTFEEVA